MSSSSSLRSSLDSNEVEGLEPVQLDAGNAWPERPSVLQRLSSATSAFWLLGSEPTSATPSPKLASRITSRSGVPSDGLDREDVFGANHIYRSLTNKSTADEESGCGVGTEEFVPETYEGQNLETTNIPPPSTAFRRRGSTMASAIHSISKKLGFWDEEFFSKRIEIVATLLQNYVFLITGFICALCIYWGAYYNRSAHYKNLQLAVVVADAEVGSLTPILGEFVSQFFESSTMETYGQFDIWNYTRISSLADSHDISIQQEVLRQVHHQKYQAAFYVHENATALMYEELLLRNGSFNPSVELLSVFYETGSDYNAMTNYVKPVLQNICFLFTSAMRSGPWTSFWVEVLGSDQASLVLSETPSLLTSLPNFLITDELPVVSQVVQAPLQIGLIYLCIFTFFQFLFSMPIYTSVSTKIKGSHFVVFRIATAQGAYFILSLSYVVLNTAFRIDFTKAFGNSGFLVIWAIAFLTMSSIGSFIEILVLVSIVLKPAMVGVCLLLVAVLNLAPTISPIYLCPDFYRYGYAMPVFNSYHLLQVAYFNSWKGDMGRHFGILIAWSLTTNALMPFVMKWVSKKMQEKKTAAASNSTAESFNKRQGFSSSSETAMVEGAQIPQ